MSWWPGGALCLISIFFAEETRELKMWVLDTSGTLELVGHSVSLLSLLISILILSSFR
jgi:hypothetical protein